MDTGGAAAEVALVVRAKTTAGHCRCCRHQILVALVFIRCRTDFEISNATVAGQRGFKIGVMIA